MGRQTKSAQKMEDAYLSNAMDDLGRDLCMFSMYGSYNEPAMRKMRRNENQEFAEDRNVWTKSNINNRNNKNNFGNRFRKPSLQSRLQNGRNLQLCFVNEQSSETEDVANENGIYSLPVISNSYEFQSKQNTSMLPSISDETMSLTPDLLSSARCNHNINNKAYDNNNNNNNNINNNISRQSDKWSTSGFREEMCTALKKVYNETHRKMELERCRRPASPITCTIKSSLKKVGVEPKEGYRGRQRVNRHMLTKLNAIQLQSIINDLHSHVEYLNEQLVQMLMERDELHMSRDSLLVDIEDLTAFLEAKRVYNKDNAKFRISNENYNNRNSNITCSKNLTSGIRLNRLTSFIKN